ncbi:MAG: CNNM domain-containing protein [Kiritimatiellaceae bacterium]|nr:CNNM domain-containing protein [Kiritimatiellaceae bacterium]
MISAFVLIIFGVLFSAFFSGVETGSYMINRIRLEQRKRERKPSALVLSKILGNPHIFIFTVLIGNNIAVFLLSKEVTDLYIASGLEAGTLLFGVIPWNAETAATLTLMFPLFLFAEVGPKNLFRKKADFLMYRFAGLMQGLILIFYPFTWPLKQLFRLLTRGMTKEPGYDLHRLSPDALKEFFSVSEKEGIISSDQGRMVENVTTMHSIPVRMLMTPFRKVPVLSDDSTVADFKQLVARRETTDAVLMHKHHVIGMVSMFEIINRKLEDHASLMPYAEDLLKLQDNRNLKSAFYRLRRNPHHSAVVVDSRKHPIGFIRLEDVARYIVKK